MKYGHRIVYRTAPLSDHTPYRCGVCGLPVSTTAFLRRDGTVVDFRRHWPERNP